MGAGKQAAMEFKRVTIQHCPGSENTEPGQFTFKGKNIISCSLYLTELRFLRYTILTMFIEYL